jgi:flagellar biosynthesis regulator FlaF
MSEENTQTADQAEEQVRQVMVDDVSYPVNELPEGIQRAIASYDIWVADRGEAQKKAAQLTSAVQHLATQISDAIKDHVAAQEAASETVAPGNDALEIADAALDIPAEDGEE